MRPTDICHPNETVCTRTSRVPSSCRSFRGADTPRSLRLRAVVLGDRTFHDVRRPLRRIVIGTSRTLEATASSRVRGRFLPTVPAAIEPLTSLSRIPVHPLASPAFAGAASRRSSFFWKVLSGSEDAETRRDHPRRRLVTAGAS
jgi:hypothetical protein